MADRIKNYQQEADQITTLKAIRTDFGVTPSSYTPDATVVTKDRVVTFAQAEEELVVLSDIEKGVKQQIVDVDIAQKDISNIKALLQGHLYDYQTDNSSAYTKSVPAGAMPYAGLEQIGGKTIVWNQLVNSGTTSVATISGHKYYTLIDGTASIVTADGTAITIVDDTADMVCDLTLMFGSGKEPASTSDFAAVFPAVHYDYSAPTLLSAEVISVVSKDSDDATINTYPIPASIQALEGYGWSVSNTVYNYIDFERKVFVKRVGKQTYLSTNVWDASITYNNIKYFTMYKPPGYTGFGTFNQLSVSPVLTAKFVSKDEFGGLDLTDYIGAILGNESRDSFWFGFPIGTTLEQARAALGGTVIYYELATPQEIDISEYLTDDNLIETEVGGTLTFHNSNGTDYQIPVPSEETYMIDLQSAIGG